MTPLPRAVRLLGVTSLLTDLSGDMVAPLLPALLAGMGAGPRWLGVLEGTADTVSAIMRYVAGRMSDRTTRRLPWVIAGYGLTGLVRPAFALASSPIGLLGLRALDRVGKGVRTAPRDALLSTAPDRSRAFAFHRAMDHTGTLLGPLVASALLALGADARTVVLASIVPGVLAVIAASQVPEEPSDAPPAAKAAVVDRPAAPGWGAFLRASALCTLARPTETLLLVHATHAGLPAVAGPLAWAAYGATKAASALRSPSLGPDPVRAARRGWSVLALACLVLGLAGGTWSALAGMMLYGAGIGLSEPMEREVVARLAPAGPGAAFGTWHAISGLTALPAAAGTAWLWEVHGPLAAFGTSATLIAAALVAARRV